ncbi:MAG: PaaI family thioesterase [Hyphomicrobiaceae bacterium]
MNETDTAPLSGYQLYDPDDPFEMRCGPFFWRRLDDGGHHFIVKAEPRHCNRQGIVHGGLMMTMIDLALAATAKEVLQDRYVTISLNSEFVAAGGNGDIIEATGELVRRTRSLAFVRGQVSTDSRVLLTASGVFKRLQDRASA